MQHKIMPGLPYPVLLSAILAELLGIVLVVAIESPLRHLGWLVIAAAAIVASVTLLRWQRSALHVGLDAQGWAVRAGGSTLQGTWDQIASVSATDQRVRLVPVSGQSIVIEAPGGARPGHFAALLDDITAHLDRHRRG